jgi:hypothetical protein
MGAGSGIASQIAFAAESTPGTAVTVTRFLEFNKESLELKKKPRQGMGLHAGGLYPRASRRGIGTTTVEGSVEIDIPIKGLGLLLKHMLGSSATATQQASTAAYKQIHTPGSLQGLSMTWQKGVPNIGGTVDPYTYRGCKVTEWEIACDVGGIATLNVNLDGWGEATGTALATASYASANDVFDFKEGTIIGGGTVSTASGLTSIGGSPTAIASVKKFSLKGTNPLDTERFFIGGGGVKDQQIENDWRTITGKLDAEYVSESASHAAFAADSQAALHLAFTGAVIESSFNYLLDIIIPVIVFEGETPKVDGPGVVQVSRDFTALDDGTNPVIQIVYISTDTAL